MPAVELAVVNKIALRAEHIAQVTIDHDLVRPGSVVGTSLEQVIEALGRYVAAGADTVNVALRAPWNPAALDRAGAAVAALR